MAAPAPAAAAPGDPRPRILVGRLFLEKYNSPDAHGSFREVLARNPRHPDALLGEARCTPAVGQEAGVTPPAPAGLRCPVAVAGVHEVGEHGAVPVEHHGALGDRHHGVGARCAVAFPALPVRAVTGPTERLVPEREEGGDVVVGDQPHVPTGATVATVRAPACHLRLPAERHGAGAAVPGLGVEVALVDKLGHCLGV